MKTLTLLAVSCLLAVGQTTPVNVLSSLGSQPNTFESCLIVGGVNIQAPGFTSVPYVPVMGLFSASTTLAYTSSGAAALPPGAMSLNVTMEGVPNSPFLLAASFVPAGIPCGGPQSVPCMTTPTLLSNVATPHGQYHLDANPVFLMDGFGFTPFPAVTNNFGQLSFIAPLTIGSIAAGGSELRLAAQAIIVDPSWPSGLRLSACFNLDQWVQQ